MCADPDEFGEYWSACSKYEFLVGLLRVDSGAIGTLLRRYSSTYYIKDAASLGSASVSWRGDSAAAAAESVHYELASLHFPTDNQMKLVTALYDKH